MITKEEVLQHWLGHRKLTRKTIEKFPEKELFEFSIGGMRPFAELAKELIAVGGSALKQAINKEEAAYTHDTSVTTKEQLLQKWDEDTALIPQYFEKVNDGNLHDKYKLFGQYEQTILGHIQYFIDNEIHHRAQGTVYLRALGIEPPFFWDRF